MEFNHIPVMLNECIGGLDIKPYGTYADFTAGGGGHSSAIAAKLNEHGTLYCFDRDIDALDFAKERLKGYSCNINFIHKNFADAADVLNVKLDGVLMDLGVSSYQIDNAGRGFSFHENARLDMRMNQADTLSAFEIVNNYSREELERIIFAYGEEKFARGIVSKIISARENAAIETTGELAEIIKRGVPLKVRREKNPCRKTFQAIRIEVNGELDSLKKGLRSAFDLLNTNGKLAVITFHSLEDRIVKTFFSDLTKGCICPAEFPVCVCGNLPKGKLLHRKAVIAAEEELRNNVRSRSAKLRIIEKV